MSWKVMNEGRLVNRGEGGGVDGVRGGSGEQGRRAGTADRPGALPAQPRAAPWGCGGSPP